MAQPWDFRRGVAGTALLVRFGGDRGVPADRLLAGSGLTAAHLAEPGAEVEARQELRVVRNLVEVLPDSGVAVGRRYRATTFGVLGFAFLSCATVHDAVETALRYLDLSFAFTDPKASVEDDRVVITLDDRSLPADVARFLAERDLAAIHTVIDDLLPGGVPVLGVGFRFAEPADTSGYDFGVRPVFGADRTGSSFDAAFLGRALPLASPEASAACQAQCRDLAGRRRDRDGTARTVRARLERSPASPAEIAAELAVSPRTLRRRLAASGTSFHELLDEARAARADVLLTTTALSVERIAEELGYAESASFIHAFRRWRGTTPGDYGRRRRAV
ncbi:AraC family transcriptional regulator [Saccharothrix longispora]|uniref:AraC-like DNA-binding protein n=1 Tax=Saccharothrix longispora TaxID=33920 RepID=A0ABU1PNY6_9PSEU|nr:AraC family transcriptional regulator [Saccharothrix longispora]MDR6592335.1 AraC-like DNA-binding protein [Saccharothrix longispora]